MTRAHIGGGHKEMQQLSSLSLLLKPTAPMDKSQKIKSMGPFLQGALMERVDTDYAAMLHKLPFNPYSQYCYWEGENLVWRVNALTNEAASHIVEPVRQMETVELRGIHTSFEITKSSLDTLSLKAVLDAVNEPSESKARIQFLTPTAFKSQGSYVILPSARLILQNLLMHYGQVYDNNKEGYSETIEYVDEHVRILSYNLRSSYFANIASGDKKVPGFLGTMTLGLRGPEMMTGLVRMLLRFGEYSGVGIKTSMGMGGFRCLY